MGVKAGAFRLVGCFLWATSLLICQQERTTAADPLRATGRAGGSYVLGPNDQLTIRALDVEEIDIKMFVVDGDGMVSMPLAGRIRAGGQTLQQFEAELAARLKEFVKEPHVTVEVTQQRLQPVFLVGTFRNPGMQHLQGNERLLELLARIGELQPNGPRRITITRSREYGALPVDSAVNDPSRHATTLEINVSHLMLAASAPENVQLHPYDVLTGSRAGTVYATGEFGRAGSIELQDRDSVSITQLIAMAGGLNKDADTEHARILRPVVTTGKLEPIPVNIKRIMAGGSEDAAVMPNDVLFVPRNSSKRGVFVRGSEIILPALISSAILVLIR